MDGLFFPFFFPIIFFFFSFFFCVLQRDLVAASAATVVDFRIIFELFFARFEENKFK